MLLYNLWIILWMLSHVDKTMSVISTEIQFKSSLCYDSKGDVVVELRCPEEFKIRTRAAYTGISSRNMCSFSSGDCAIHEGRTYRCDGNNRCQVQVSFRQDTSPLSCGRADTAYFQVEYDCLAESGEKIQSGLVALQEPSRHSTPRIRNELNFDDFPIETYGNGTSRDATKQENPPNEKIKLMSIIAGSCVGFLIFSVVVVAIVKRLQKKSYPSSPLYRAGQHLPPPPPPPAHDASLGRNLPSRMSRGSMTGSQLSQAESASQHSRLSSVGVGHSLGDSGLGQGTCSSDLSAPGSVSSLFPKQSLRDLALLRGYPPRELERIYREQQLGEMRGVNVEAIL